MSDIMSIPAQARERAGKGPARAARRAGLVPGVIYGAKKDPLMITLDPRDVIKGLKTGSFLATIYELDVSGKKERVLPRDVQFDPVTDNAIHVDFLRVSAATSVTVEVPVQFLNEEEAPGLRRGGLLNIVRHEIEMTCRADAIPNQIEVDLTGLDIGDSVHISTITLPDGVEPTITDRDFTIATIAAPTIAIEEEEAEAAAAEGEVEGEAAADEEKTEEEGESEG
jgi:large subunit ribosomal protein L25